MRETGWTRKAAAAVVAAGALWSAGPANAGDVVYPGDYYGRADLPLPQAFAHLERLISDRDNFEPVSAFSESNRYRIMAAPIGRLDLLVEEGGEQHVSLCTGWIISAEYILTNNHCIPGHKGRVMKASLVMNYMEEGKTANVERYDVETQPVETSEKLDYAVVRVAGNPGAKYGVIPLKARDAQPGEELFVIQHPAGKPKRLTRRNCRADDSAERPDELRHFCDTLGGSSGSPVFSDNDMALVGLHFAGIENEVNFAKRMTAILDSSALLQRIAAATSGGTPPQEGTTQQAKPPVPEAQPQPAMPAPAPTPAPAPAQPATGGGWQVIN